MLVSIYGFDGVTVPTAAEDVGTRRDTARIAAQVVSGIGFLGAGTILHEGLTIRGLTTAASLWIVSAIGLAVGSGMLLLATVATVLTMITLVTFHSWEKRFAGNNRSERRFIRVTAKNNSGVITNITGYLASKCVRIKTMNIKNNQDKSILVLELYVKVEKGMDLTDIMRGLQKIEGVTALENA